MAAWIACPSNVHRSAERVAPAQRDDAPASHRYDRRKPLVPLADSTTPNTAGTMPSRPEAPTFRRGIHAWHRPTRRAASVSPGARIGTSPTDPAAEAGDQTIDEAPPQGAVGEGVATPGDGAGRGHPGPGICGPVRTGPRPRRARKHAAATSTPPARKPNKFMADLTKAMQTAAESARADVLEKFNAEAKAHIEGIHASTADEATAAPQAGRRRCRRRSANGRRPRSRTSARRPTSASRIGRMSSSARSRRMPRRSRRASSASRRA